MRTGRTSNEQEAGKAEKIRIAERLMKAEGEAEMETRNDQTGSLLQALESCIQEKERLKKETESAKKENLERRNEEIDTETGRILTRLISLRISRDEEKTFLAVLEKLVKIYKEQNLQDPDSQAAGINMAKADLLKSRVYLNKGQGHQAIDCVFDALRHLEKLNSPEELETREEAYYVFAEVALGNGSEDREMKYLENAFWCFRELEDPSGNAVGIAFSSCIRLSKIYARRGNKGEAENYGKEALHLAEDLANMRPDRENQTRITQAKLDLEKIRKLKKGKDHPH